MGVIKGAYDAKEKAFSVGCSSLHLPMTAHGPEAEVFDKVVILRFLNDNFQASTADLKPVKLEGNMAFMFESSFFLRTTNWAMDDTIIEHDKNYYKVKRNLNIEGLINEQCWQGLKDNFDPTKK